MEQIKPVLAVVGAPQTGKTTLVSTLSQSSYFEVVDTQGTHVLAANTQEDSMLYNFLLGKEGNKTPDAVLVLAGADQLHDHLYLVGQVLDLRLPTLVCLTYAGTEMGERLVLNEDRLASMLRAPVLRIKQNDAKNLVDLEKSVSELLSKKEKIKAGHWQPTMALASAYNHLDNAWLHKHLRLHTGARLIEGLRLISNDKAIEDYVQHPAFNALRKSLEDAREKMEKQNQSWQVGEAAQRYQWAGQVATAVVKKTPTPDPKTAMPGWKRRLAAFPTWVGLLFLVLALIIAVLAALYL